jgi:hypothetical protein
VGDLAQCYSHKRQLAKKELDWRSSINFDPPMKPFYIFFSYPAAKYVWSLVGTVVGAQTRPSRLLNSFGGCLGSLGLAAMSRSLAWLPSAMRYGKCVTDLVLRKKILKNRVDLICQPVTFMK